jgi:chemotaxis protein histidine kinase CheA
LAWFIGEINMAKKKQTNEFVEADSRTETKEKDYAENIEKEPMTSAKRKNEPSTADTDPLVEAIPESEQESTSSEEEKEAPHPYRQTSQIFEKDFESNKAAFDTDKYTDKSSYAPGENVGPSPHIATDKWTRDDTLGYIDYAHAIARFLTDTQTKSPLSISIQSPWGGGKTSLMRMVQKELDTEADQSFLDGVPLVETEYKKTVNDILKVLKKLEKKDKEKKAYKIRDIKKDADKVKPRVTIWFNAWKYENTQQVWAGLADSIVKQIVRRLKPEEREEFLFELHLRRQNIDKIRTKIYDHILKSWWQKTRPWIWASITGLGISIFISIIGSNLINTQTDDVLKNYFGWGGFGGLILSIVGGAIPSFKNYLDLKNEPAEMVAGEFVDMPDYSANLSFIHHVEADLRRVFEAIPKEEDKNKNFLPMVIFIDDLDRCSPEKIADVVEGINLFLAGEFEDCIFVLGIDAEMVAAALEAAHSKVIDQLPKYSTRTPLGRRFMDKFVQLPILIPIPEKENINSYVESLLSHDKHYNIGATYLENKEKRTARIQKLDEKIDNYSDNDPKIRELITGATSSFSNNPREMKRFMNVFRFQYFLLLARKNRGLSVPSDEQLKRWIILSLKWPEVVRWLQWRNSSQVTHKHSENGGNSNAGLKNLEEVFGSKITDQEEWQKMVTNILGTEVTNTSWIADEGLREFFIAETNEKDSNKKLSTSVGNGFY